MTREEAIQLLRHIIQVADTSDCGIKEIDGTDEEALEMAIKALEQEPCDAISRQAAKEAMESISDSICEQQAIDALCKLPPVNPQRMGHCKECKYFEYNYKVDGMPLIVAHEICSKWGDGCMTKEDGYCFLFEPQAEGSGEE